VRRLRTTRSGRADAGPAGAPPGLFRLPWVRATANLNELFVHHEDLRRANGLPPRTDLPAGLDDALWRNVRVGARYLTRRALSSGLTVRREGTDDDDVVRRGEPTVTAAGMPGELLMFLFGRAGTEVEVTGPPDAVAAFRASHLGM
jgi:uncharacterized protein (TIGR03085 family)